MQSLDGLLTSLESNTCPTGRDIFTLKSSNLVRSINSINTFCYFLNSNVIEIYEQIPFLASTDYGDGTSIFSEKLFLDYFQPKLKSNSLYMRLSLYMTRHQTGISSGLQEKKTVMKKPDQEN